MINRFLTTREQLVLAAFACAILIGSATMYYLRATPPGPDLARAAEVAPGNLPPIEELEPPAAPAPLAAPAILAPPEAPKVIEKPSALVVAVEGEVYLPGVYTLETGDRVEDAVGRAGGATEDADLSDINLAAALMDATTLHIPKKPYAGRDGEVLVLRRGPKAADLNPPQYTRSGWRSVQATQTSAGDAAENTPKPVAAAVAGNDNGLININTASQSELETLPGIGPVTAQKIMAHREAHPFTSVESLTDVSGIGPKTLESVRSLVTVQ